MKINCIFNEEGKTFQEIIELFLINYYNEKLLKKK